MNAYIALKKRIATMDDDLQQLAYQCELENQQREIEEIEYFNRQCEYYLSLERKNGT
jgi:hypothetical protein